jgi:hypothetical protein
MVTREWSYGNEAADVRVSDPVAACCPVVVCAGRARLEAENLILHQQLGVLRRKSPKRVRLWRVLPIRKRLANSAKPWN